MQRLNSFLAGLGLGVFLTGYFVTTELIDSNEKFSLQINHINSRLDSIEKKK